MIVIPNLRDKTTKLCGLIPLSSLINFFEINVGITKLLLSIVDNEIVSTITIPVAAESPPKNTIKVSQRFPVLIGKASTKVSGSM